MRNEPEANAPNVIREKINTRAVFFINLVSRVNRRDLNFGI